MLFYFQKVLNQKLNDFFCENKYIFSACLNSEVTFFLYTLYNQDEGIQILPGKDLNSSNLLQTYFNPLVPSKILIHGYNSDVFGGDERS